MKVLKRRTEEEVKKETVLKGEELEAGKFHDTHSLFIYRFGKRENPKRKKGRGCEGRRRCTTVRGKPGNGKTRMQGKQITDAGKHPLM